MFFELQLSAGVFTRIVRNRLKAISICLDREMPGPDGDVLVVDQVIIGGSTWIQREQVVEIVNNLPTTRDIATQRVWIFSPTNFRDIVVPFLQVKQEVVIHLVKSKDLDANGPNPSPPAQTLTIYPVFNVALTVGSQVVGGGGPLNLSYTLAQIDFGLLALALTPQQRAEIEQYIAGVRLPPTTVDLGALSALLKRPVAAINAGIACDPSGQFVALRADIDVYASPVALDRPFFEAGPANHLAGKDWAMLIDANILVADSHDRAKKAFTSAPKVKLDSGPDVRWDPYGPALDISAAVELVDACPFFIDDIDMDADVDIRASFSVPTPNTLRTHFNISGEPSDVGEEIACALTGALLWPFIGPVMLKDEDIGEGIGYYLAGLAAGPLLAFIGIIVAIETKGLTKDLSKNLGDNCKKVGDDYECNDTLDMRMALTPGANSRLDLEAVAGVPEGLVLRGTISNLRDFPTGSLAPVAARPFVWKLVGGCRGNGKHNFTVKNRAEIDVYGDPQVALCKAYVFSDPLGEFVLTIEQDEIVITPQFKPVYTADPYPCRVRIVTNRGVRTITFPPAVAITPAESEGLEVARLRAVASCYYWEKFFTPVEKIKWLPDPAPYARQVIHYWQIAVRGMQPQDTLRVEGLEDATVMTANPSRSGVTHMTMLFPGERAPQELSVELNRTGGSENEEGREISVQQVLFEQFATLPVSGPPQAMRFLGSGANRRLEIVEDGQEMLWNVSEPSAPFLLRSAARAGQDAPAEIVLQSGKRIGAAPSENLLRALDQIQGRFGRALAVGSPRVGGIDEALYVRTDEGAILFDISGDEEPRELHRYEAPAWLEGVALGGKLMARYNADAGAVEIYSATQTRNL